jgi:hypothetical protein
MADGDVLIERLLRVIDEGRRTATYKLALVTELLDAIAEMPGESEIPTRTIAERIIELYYPQTQPYADTAGRTQPIRQITMKSSVVIDAVTTLRGEVETPGARTPGEIRSSAGWARTVGVVEDT